MAGNVFIVIFFSGAIQTMWGMINSLQMMVITLLFSVFQPINSHILQLSILQLCAFDLFKSEDYYKTFFRFDETESFNLVFEQSSMEGHIFILGIGPVFLVYLFYPIYGITHAMIRYVLKG